MEACDTLRDVLGLVQMGALGHTHHHALVA